MPAASSAVAVGSSPSAAQSPARAVASAAPAGSNTGRRPPAAAASADREAETRRRHRFLRRSHYRPYPQLGHLYRAPWSSRLSRCPHLLFPTQPVSRGQGQSRQHPRTHTHHRPDTHPARRYHRASSGAAFFTAGAHRSAATPVQSCHCRPGPPLRARLNGRAPHRCGCGGGSAVFFSPPPDWGAVLVTSKESYHRRSFLDRLGAVLLIVAEGLAREAPAQFFVGAAGAS